MFFFNFRLHRRMPCKVILWYAETTEHALRHPSSLIAWRGGPARETRSSCIPVFFTSSKIKKSIGLTWFCVSVKNYYSKDVLDLAQTEYKSFLNISFHSHKDRIKWLGWRRRPREFLLIFNIFVLITSTGHGSSGGFYPDRFMYLPHIPRG